VNGDIDRRQVAEAVAELGAAGIDVRYQIRVIAQPKPIRGEVEFADYLFVWILARPVDAQPGAVAEAIRVTFGPAAGTRITIV
jgi:hypothetical protein